VRKDRVLIAEDEVHLREALRIFLETHEYEVVATDSCANVEHFWRTARPDIAVLDYRLPDGDALELLSRLRSVEASTPIVILTGYGSIDLAVEAVKRGAEQFLTKPVELATLLVVIKRSIENVRNRQKQLAENSRLARDLKDPFIGSSPVIRSLAEKVDRVIMTDSPILIQGETGTGKGVLARWFHYRGPRAAEPFVDLNCGGLFRELLESELFGYERGAFTGAVQSKSGLLEIAHKGTVFLDEIGDVDMQVQPKLLKVLEEKQFRRLGNVRDIRVDIRLIAATHQDIGKLVQDKLFRSDLYFRISTIPITTPPLRQRLEDIPVLASHLLDRITSDLGMGAVELAHDAITAMQSYPWPGNIRELRNVLERAVLLSGKSLLHEKDLHFDTRPERPKLREEDVQTLEEMERKYIEEVLFLEGGRVEAAAKRLGIPRSSLYQKIKQYRITRPGLAV